MYRKHLKMARGEGEQAEGIRSHFVERVVKLPIVHSAWDYAANTYTHIKESNKLVNFTLTNAERSVTFVAGQAKPVVMKFEKQIQVVDSLACKGLGTLEEKVPFITKPADEIITDTTTTVYSRLEGLKKYGNDKVKSITDYSLQKANAILGKEIVDSLLVTVDGALVITETYLDRFLPPTEEEKKNKKEDAGKSELSRLVDIPNKIFRRSYKAVVLRFEYAQEWAVELLIYPLTIVETYKAYAENALQYLVQFWESKKKEHTTGMEDGDKSQLEQQLLHLGRLVSRQMAAAHTTAPSPTGSDVYDFEDEPVHDNQVGYFDCIKHCDGSNASTYWNHKSYSSTPTYVHLWICILA